MNPQTVFFFTISIALLASLSPALPTRSTTPMPPSQDPWYTAPENFTSASPGDILKIRNAPGNLTTVFSNSSAAHNILYRTTDSHYQPSWAVTTLFVPKQTDGEALLSYQIPYDTANVDGSPSYILYAPPSTFSSTTDQDIKNALGAGWYVNVPDFEGPLAALGDGVQSGHAVLDSVRAVLQTDCGLAHDAKYAMWGYSGGSIGSEWAAELQVQYAPELHFAGTALGGLVPRVANIYSPIEGTMWAALIPETLVGATSQYPEARELLLSQLKDEGPYNKTTFMSVQDKIGIAEAFEVFGNQTISHYFHDFEGFIQSPVMQTLFDRDTIMGLHGVPEMPLFVYKAIADEITPINDTDRLVDRYCSFGAGILYERNTVGGHLAEMTNGDMGAFEWLQSVLNGSYAHSGCTVRNVAINVTDSPL